MYGSYSFCKPFHRVISSKLGKWRMVSDWAYHVNNQFRAQPRVAAEFDTFSSQRKCLESTTELCKISRHTRGYS